MSREFTLVLLGSGALAAGYALAPGGDEVVEQQADAVAAAQTGHATTAHRTHGSYLPLLLFVHSRGYAGAGYSNTPGRSAASPAVSRGGFGTTGRAVGAGGSAAS